MTKPEINYAKQCTSNYSYNYSIARDAVSK